MNEQSQWEFKKLDPAAVVYGQNASQITWVIEESLDRGTFEVFGEHPSYAPGVYSLADGSLIAEFPPGAPSTNAR